MDLSDQTDAELISHITQLRPDALSELYNRYKNLLYSLAVRIVGDQHRAEDILQDVLIRIWHKASIYRKEHGSVITWITNITRNRAIDELRRASVRSDHTPQLELSTNHHSSVESPESAAQRSWERDQIHQAIDSLSIEQREAIYLAYFEGLSHRLIARRMQKPLGTVKTYIRSAMLRLRDRFEAASEFQER